MAKISIDEYKKQLYGSGEDTSINSKSTSNDYYQMVKNQEYSNLLNKEIELANARNNANKYTMNQINAQGLGTQGYGSSMQASATNRYLSQLEANKNEYQKNINTINQEQYQNNQTEIGEDYDIIASANNLDDLNNYLVNKGYGQLDDTGKFVLKADSGMTAKDQYLFNQYYEDAYNRLNIVDTNGTNVTDKGYITNSLQSANGVNYQVQFYQGTGLNKNFNVPIGNNVYQLEMGNTCGAYPKLGLSKAESELLYKDKNIGEMWIHTNKDNSFVLIKDQNGTIRVVEPTGANREDYAKAMKELGFGNRTKIRTTIPSPSGYYTVNK